MKRRRDTSARQLGTYRKRARPHYKRKKTSWTEVGALRDIRYKMSHVVSLEAAHTTTHWLWNVVDVPTAEALAASASTS